MTQLDQAALAAAIETVARAHDNTAYADDAAFSAMDEAVCLLRRLERITDELTGDRDRAARDRDVAERALAEAGRRFAAKDLEGVRLLLCDTNARSHAAALAPAATQGGAEPDARREEREWCAAWIEGSPLVLEANRGFIGDCLRAGRTGKIAPAPAPEAERGAAERDWQAFQNAQGGWSDETFGAEHDGAGARAHLLRELREVETATGEERVIEYADCAMLLFDAARRDGISVSDVLTAAWKKLDVNKARAWGERQPDGTVEHVRAPAAQDAGLAEAARVLDEALKWADADERALEFSSEDADVALRVAVVVLRSSVDSYRAALDRARTGEGL